MNYLPTDNQPTQVKVATITKTDMSFLHKSLIVFGGLCSVIFSLTLVSDGAFDGEIQRCNDGHKAACISLMEYPTTWDEITGEYGTSLVIQHYNNQL